MSSRECLGWRVPTTEWEAFQAFVAKKWGAQDAYLRFELESAMREFLDHDETLHEAEQLLRTHTHPDRLSSSSVAGGITYDGDTTKLGHRVQSELKDEFAATAKDRFDRNLGRVLARALNSYRGGGRRQRVLTLVEELVRGGSDRDTTDDDDENGPAKQAHRDTTNAADENRTRDTTRTDENRGDTTERSTETSDKATAEVTKPNVNSDQSTQPAATSSNDTTAGLDATSPGTVDARIVEAIAAECGESFRRDRLHKQIAMRAGGDADTIRLYTEAVTEYLDVVEHPVQEDLYIPEQARANITVYADLDRQERADALRTMLCAEALRHRTGAYGISYTDVQQLFEDEYSGAPSHDYAYTLMKAAADTPGFTYAQDHSPTQLRVDLERVPDRYLEETKSFAGVETDLVAKLRQSDHTPQPQTPESPTQDTQSRPDLDVTSFSPATSQSREASSDD